MKLTHINEQGRARMVNVSDKSETKRTATAAARIMASDAVLEAVEKGSRKGDVLSVAQVAGIMGAKNTAQNIPMCHPLQLTGADIRFALHRESGFLDIEATVTTTGKTGVEMEALSAVTTAALTVYDMCKAVDKGIEIQSVRLVEKTGGKSGTWRAEAGTD